MSNPVPASKRRADLTIFVRELTTAEKLFNVRVMYDDMDEASMQIYAAPWLRYSNRLRLHIGYARAVARIYAFN